jgi:hypothetical protein
LGTQKTKSSNISLEEKGQCWKQHIFLFQNTFQSYSNQIVWFQHKCRCTSQQSIIESLEINPHILVNSSLIKVPRIYKREMTVYSKVVWGGKGRGRIEYNERSKLVQGTHVWDYHNEIPSY